MRTLLGLSTIIASLIGLVVARNLEIHRKWTSKRHAQAQVVRELDSSNEVAALGARDLEKRFEGARFTFYDAGLGACEKTNANSDFIVALNSIQYDSARHCFETITIIANGKTATAQIMDRCPGCPYGGLDFSRGLFNYFAAESVGVLTGAWYFGATPATPTTTTTTTPTPTPTPTTTYIPSPSPSPTTTTTSKFYTPISSPSSGFSSSTTSTSSSSTSSAVETLRSSSPNTTTSGVLEQLNLVFVNLGAIVVVGGRGN